ncbi:hypothetical protein HOLleu_16138 [Holothuria leucospilota]|uniref:Uncharacterized protein n=1 Tax=Holothuria leucospilota TaxID=206669 RepID=A0A9Q1HAQ2_HOLLE|nr:hypothetical protein HOLleu_16138 [Holothuria leucospilota]
MNTFVISFFLLGIAFSIVQEISAELHFWYDDDELYDVNKRKANWESFERKHVFRVVDKSITADENFWKNEACRLFGNNEFGPAKRREQTFILEERDLVPDIETNFNGREECKTIDPKPFRGIKKLYKKKLVWNSKTCEYDVSFPEKQAHICAALDNDGRPLHYGGKEE